jgi:hypothetical protein
MKNPNHEKKNTRPYMFTTLNTGIDLALWFTGLTSGASQRTDNRTIAVEMDYAKE